MNLCLAFRPLARTTRSARRNDPLRLRSMWAIVRPHHGKQDQPSNQNHGKDQRWILSSCCAFAVPDYHSG
jgi:hypothetical protein